MMSILSYKREDLRTNHKGADNILAHQMVVVASEKNKVVTVISNNTRVLVLLIIIMSSQAYWGSDHGITC